MEQRPRIIIIITALPKIKSEIKLIENYIHQRVLLLREQTCHLLKLDNTDKNFGFYIQEPRLEKFWGFWRLYRLTCRDYVISCLFFKAMIIELAMSTGLNRIRWVKSLKIYRFQMTRSITGTQLSKMFLGRHVFTQTDVWNV